MRPSAFALVYLLVAYTSMAAPFPERQFDARSPSGSLRSSEVKLDGLSTGSMCNTQPNRLSRTQSAPAAGRAGSQQQHHNTGGASTPPGSPAALSRPNSPMGATGSPGSGQIHPSPQTSPRPVLQRPASGFGSSAAANPHTSSKPGSLHGPVPTKNTGDDNTPGSNSPAARPVGQNQSDSPQGGGKSKDSKEEEDRRAKHDAKVLELQRKTYEATIKQNDRMRGSALAGNLITGTGVAVAGAAAGAAWTSAMKAAGEKDSQTNQTDPDAGKNQTAGAATNQTSASHDPATGQAPKERRHFVELDYSA